MTTANKDIRGCIRLLGLMVVIVGMINACVPVALAKEVPKAVHGVLDLTAWAFTRDGPVLLNGEWAFYWRQHLPPDAFSAQNPPTPTGFLNVPGLWNGVDVDGETLAGDGYATYHLRVLLGHRRGRLALKFLDMASAFVVYVNGTKRFAAGVPTRTPETTRAQFSPGVSDFAVDASHLDIVIHVANFSHRKGGAWEAIRLGTVDDLRRMRERSLIFSLFLCGSILIMGLYHLGLFALRRSERSPLYFGLFCLLITVRILLVGERYIMQMLPSFPWELLVKLSYLTFYLGVPSFTLYVGSLFRQDLSCRAVTIIVGVSGLFSGIVLLTPARLYTHTTPAFQLFTVLTLLYGSYALIRAAIRQREGGVVFFIGFFVLFLTVLNDILYSNLLITTGYLIQFGFFGFIFSQAFLLSMRFSKAFALVEAQHRELIATNQAYAQEIQDRKRIEEALRISEAALAEAQRMARIGSWEWDVRTGKIVCSDEVLRIFALPPQELSYELVASMTHADDRGRWQSVMRLALDDKVPLQIDYRAVRANGEVCWIHSEGEVLHDDAGNPLKLFGTFQDITERKRMEEELLKTSKLESIGVLAGGLAHDFNNILTAIIGNLSLAKLEAEAAGRDVHLLQEIEHAATRATALTHQLLAFSRGGAPVKRMAALADILREPSIFALRGTNVRCEFAISDDLWPAEVDVGQINQVIHNLVLNGAQAMPDGGSVVVRAENISIDRTTGLPLLPGPYLHIAIEDHGTGIQDDHLAKIFDPYFTTKSAGSGLGLTMTYAIIKRHDGHIAVDSRLGVGTTFHLYLPADASSHSPGPEDPPPPRRGQGKILVMDDEASIRLPVEQMLQFLGYAVEVTRDGAEAIARYQQAMTAGQPFDVVILDLTVPGGMGGREAVQRLREIDPNVRAIVSSGYSNDPVMADFAAYGFRGVMAKPYTLVELSETLHHVMASPAP